MHINSRIRAIVLVVTVFVTVSFFHIFLPVSEQKVYASAEEEFWYSLSSDYYYSKLTDRQKRLYDTVNRACMDVLLSDDNCGDITVDIDYLGYTRSDIEEITTVMRLFYGANPQYFFNRNGYSYQSGRVTGRITTFAVKINPEFQSGAHRAEVREQIRAKLNDYFAAVPDGALPETIEKIIHDKMCLDIEYNHTAYQAGDTSAYQTISSATAGVSVCNGYALLFEGLMNHFDIPCVYDSSDGHAWNIINLHGYWYYVDTTWDDQKGSNLYYRFYNCSDATFQNDSDPSSHLPEDIYNGIRPRVVYDDLNDGGRNNRFSFYSDRYMNAGGKTYFIINDYEDYGYLAVPVGTGTFAGSVNYNGNTYTVINTDSNITREFPTACPTTAPEQIETSSVSSFIWFCQDPDDATRMRSCANSYHNTKVIDLDIRLNGTHDVSTVYYRVWYNDILIFTSSRGTLEGYFYTTSSGASTVNTPEGTCLAPGSYTIRFYSGETELGGERCTVTADVIDGGNSSEDTGNRVTGTCWYLCNGNGDGQYINTPVIDLDINFRQGADYSDVYYQVFFNGNRVYTSQKGVREGFFRVSYSGASTTTVNDDVYLMAGSYTIRFFDGSDNVIGEGTATVSVNPGYNGDSAATVTTESGVSGFVERLYTVALNRTSDPVGKQDWIDAITLRGNTGADAARGFLYSSEFTGRGLSNSNFVRTLYRTFFGREADEAGLKAWEAVLTAGGSRQEVTEGFINSTEWANLCLRYGIRSGGTGTPNITVEPSQGTLDFCSRLYTTCLNRSADQGGLVAWANQLANQRDTGTGAARGFFFSSEFTNQNVSNGEYVTRLYRTFMGREPDSDGFNAWVSQLDSGVSREEVFSGFSDSIEFARICASYGIVR